MENETIVTGKKLRRFVDGAWERMSFWHKASDCEMNDGKNLEVEIQDIKNLIQSTKTNIKNELKTEHDDFKKQILVYNENSDYYQGYVDGQWKDLIYAGLKYDGYLVKDGAINDNFCGGLMFNANLPLQTKSYCDAVITKPYINSIYTSNATKSNDDIFNKYLFDHVTINNPITSTTLDHLFCCTYSYSETSFVGRAAGSLFSAFPIRLDTYSTVTIDYSISLINTGKNAQMLSFGFTRQPNVNLWFKYLDSGYETVFNEVQTALPVPPYDNKETMQLDVSALTGYGYFTISLINPNSTASMNVNIYNIKFE